MMCYYLNVHLQGQSVNKRNLSLQFSNSPQYRMSWNSVQRFLCSCFLIERYPKLKRKYFAEFFLGWAKEGFLPQAWMCGCFFHSRHCRREPRIFSVLNLSLLPSCGWVAWDSFLRHGMFTGKGRWKHKDIGGKNSWKIQRRSVESTTCWISRTGFTF